MSPKPQVIKALVEAMRDPMLIVEDPIVCEMFEKMLGKLVYHDVIASAAPAPGVTSDRHAIDFEYGSIYIDEKRVNLPGSKYVEYDVDVVLNEEFVYEETNEWNEALWYCPKCKSLFKRILYKPASRYEALQEFATVKIFAKYLMGKDEGIPCPNCGTPLEMICPNCHTGGVVRIICYADGSVGLECSWCGWRL